MKKYVLNTIINDIYQTLTLNNEKTPCVIITPSAILSNSTNCDDNDKGMNNVDLIEDVEWEVETNHLLSNVVPTICRSYYTTPNIALFKIVSCIVIATWKQLICTLNNSHANSDSEAVVLYIKLFKDYHVQILVQWLFIQLSSGAFIML